VHVSSVTKKRSKQKRDSEIGEIVCFVPLLYIPGKGHLYMPPAPRDRIISFLSFRDQGAFACLNREGERVMKSYRKFVLTQGFEIVCFVPLLYIPGKGHLYMPPAPRDRIISFLSHRDQCAFACLNREGERVIDSYRAFVLADGRFFHSLSF
jgi:hypothetical protein